MLPKSIFSLSAVRITLGLVQVISPLIVVRMLPVDEFGSYQGFVAITSVLVVFASLGFDAAVVYYLPNVRSDEKQLLGNTTKAILYISVSVVLLFNLLAISRVFGDFERLFVLQVSAFVLLFSNLNWIENYLLVKKRIGVLSVYAALRISTRICGVLVAAFFFGDANSIIWSTIIVELCRFFLVLYWVSTRSLVSFGGTWVIPSAQAGYAIPVGLSGVCQALSQHAGKVAVLAICGPTVLAFYAIGSYIQTLARTVKVGIQEAVFPELVRVATDSKKSFDLFRQSTVLQFAIFFPLFLFLNLRAVECTEAFISHQYVKAVPVIQIFSVLMIRRVFSFDSLFRAAGVSIHAFTGSVTGLVLNAMLTIILWPFIDWYAAAVGYVASQIILEIIYLKRAQDILSARIADLLDVSNLGRCILAAICAASWLSAWEYIFDSYGMWLLVEGLIYLLLTLMLMKLFGVTVIVESFAKVAEGLSRDKKSG